MSCHRPWMSTAGNSELVPWHDILVMPRDFLFRKISPLRTNCQAYTRTHDKPVRSSHTLGWQSRHASRTDLSWPHDRDVILRRSVHKNTGEESLSHEVNKARHSDSAAPANAHSVTFMHDSRQPYRSPIRDLVQAGGRIWCKCGANRPRPWCKQRKRPENIASDLVLSGGRCWIRTSDPIRVKDVLYP